MKKITNIITLILLSSLLFSCGSKVYTQNEINNLIGQLLNGETSKSAEKQLLEIHEKAQPCLESYLDEYQAKTDKLEEDLKYMAALLGLNDPEVLAASEIVSKRHKNITILKNVLKKIKQLKPPS